MLAGLDLGSGDRLVFVGDLVDKGPDSLGVLRRARELVRAYPGSVVVSGNHEEAALRWWRRGEAVEHWVHGATADDWAFIEAMPLTWAEPERGLRVVHGGIFPKLLERHPDVFDVIEAGGDWRKSRRKVLERARRMLRVRHVSPRGEMVSYGQESSHDPYWTEVYDGSAGFVIYGHQVWDSGAPREDPHACGIDTGCVHGGYLTALVHQPGRSPAFVQEPARQKYAERHGWRPGRRQPVQRA